MLTVADMMSPAAEQMSQHAAWQRYEAEALGLISARFPAVACTLSREASCALIAHSYQSAKAMGFVTTADHLQYLVPVFFWGSYFGSDAQLAADLEAAGWHSQSPARPSLKRLAHQIDLYAADTKGDMASYRRILDDLGYALRLSAEQPTAAQVCEACALVWPHRAARLGQGGLTGFVAQSGKRAHELGLAGPDVTLYCIMALYFGHGFDCDPLYPWAMDAFAQPEPAPRRRGLLAGFRGFFDARMGQGAEGAA